MIRDSMDVQDSTAFEVAPLIPEPPIKRKRKFTHRNPLHRCWNLFTHCSRWTCLFITLAMIVLIIILCKSLLPFGWPSWIPSLSYDKNDPHIVLIVVDDLGWNDVGYAKYLNNDNNNNNENNNNDDSTTNTNTNKKYKFNDFMKILEMEKSKELIFKSNTDETSDTDETTETETTETDSDTETETDFDKELFSDGQSFATKNIDSLASNGILLNRFYVSQEGSATRTSILTGQHSYRVGLQNGINTGSSAHIPLSINTISEILSNERGYSTNLIGKWNLGYSKWKYTPTLRGFDTFVGFHQKWLDYWHYTASDDSPQYENRVGWDLWKNKKIYDLSVSQRIFSTELFTDEATKVIEEHATGSTPDRPMFLMYAAPNPHTPLDYHSKFSDYCESMEESLREKYCNVVQSLDMSVGAIVSSLKENNMYDRSLIIMVSDNGGLICYDIGDNNKCSGSSNAPLRAGKGTLFEGGIRTRAFISGGVIPQTRKGSYYNKPMLHVDLFNTMLTAANVNSDDYAPTDGLNHYNLFVDETAETFKARESGVIDLVMDDDNNLMRGAYISYPYKYVLQVEEAYDGWYTSPFDGGDEIPEDAQALQGEYESPRAGRVSVVDDFEQYVNYLQSKVKTSKNSKNTIKDESSSTILSFDEVTEESGISKTKVLYFGETETNEDSSLLTMTFNEYLFDIENDETEEYNLAETNSNVVLNLRNKLINIVVNEEYRMPQDGTSNDVSSPIFFNNIWWPFDEKKN